MALAQYKFNPHHNDEERFFGLINAKFGTAIEVGKWGDITDNWSETNPTSYFRNARVWLKDNKLPPEYQTGDKYWYYDKVDIGEYLINFGPRYIYSEQVHFHDGLPHHADEVADWMWDTFNLVVSEWEVTTDSKGSGGPFYHWHYAVHPDSYTMTGDVIFYVRNKWKDHYDEFLDIFELPDITTL